jgi:hypothetical protein
VIFDETILKIILGVAMLLERIFQTDYNATGYSSVQESAKTEEPIRLVKTTQQGASFDPNGFDLTIEIVGTGFHVGLKIVSSSKPNQTWDYDFSNMRLVTADGVEIPNASKQTLDRMRAIVQPNLVPLVSKKAAAPGLRQG